ncbi:MAG: YceI family protein [Actinomycetota bacterium]|nr:YceI family protein [Actinomycetota bacterium]
MTTWMFEPGHTEAEFRARHMMVTWVRGLFKDIHGEIEFDLDDCMSTTFHGEIDATKLWTGEPDRDWRATRSTSRSTSRQSAWRTSSAPGRSTTTGLTTLAAGT